MRVIRCLREADFHDIKRGTYHPNSVPVYYGFDNYCDSVEHINNLVEIIKSENPTLAAKDMYVMRIPTTVSVRHAHQTMVYVSRNPYNVKARFEDYTIL